MWRDFSPNDMGVRDMGFCSENKKKECLQSCFYVSELSSFLEGGNNGKAALLYFRYYMIYLCYCCISPSVSFPISSQSSIR